MPSPLQEMLVELFVARPALAPEMLADVLGMDLAPFDVGAVSSAGATEVNPTEYRADAVVTLTDCGRSVLAVIVEAQLRPKAEKRWSWPVYVATLRARLRCPVVLMVVCVDAPTAAWCAEPIELGNPDSSLRPVVVGPGDVPVVADPEQAALTPELTVLSAMAHGARPERVDVLHALRAALATLETDRAGLYLDIVLKALPGAARRYLEELMLDIKNYEYQSDFMRKHVGAKQKEARAEARGEAVLSVLDARGVDVRDGARQRITACTDLEQLDVWLRRAATAESVDELFARQ